jgi:hypothetical protein
VPADPRRAPKQSFLGFMFYNRFWFDRDHFGLTVGGGKINNPGHYRTSYFTENPGDVFKAWDMSGTFDWMPSQYPPSVASSTTARRTFLTPPGPEVSPRRRAQRLLSWKTFAGRRGHSCRDSRQTSKKLRTESTYRYSSSFEVLGQFHLELVGTMGRQMSYTQRQNGNRRKEA